jgi:hypothetical protein
MSNVIVMDSSSSAYKASNRFIAPAQNTIRNYAPQILVPKDLEGAHKTKVCKLFSWLVLHSCILMTDWLDTRG